MKRWTIQRKEDGGPGDETACERPDCPVGADSEHAPENGNGNGNHSRRRIRKIHWRTIDISPEMFVEVTNRELQGAAAMESAPDTDEGLQELLRICDYHFLMGLRAPRNSVLPDEQRPEGQMRLHGFLPLGIAFDQQIQDEALYVLVRDREPPLAQPPYLKHEIYRYLKTILGRHLEESRHLVLLGTGGRLVEQGVNYFYYHVKIEAGEGDDEVATPPLSINVQPNDPEAIRQARLWLMDAIYRRASDVHLEPGDGAGRVRMRVDGEMVQTHSGIPPSILVQVITWIKAQSRMDISERRRPLDGGLRLAYTSSRNDTRIVDVRVSTIPTIHGQKMVMRLLDPETLKELAAGGLRGTIPDERLHHLFTDALDTRDGIVLVTGPTGSGKTTTLNSALFHLLRQHGERRNIVTIEDPVEYNVGGVNQIQVNEQAGVTFSRALRSILRQDPDIVLVGEIRDPDTAAVAIQAALTGHLILATLHTNDALGAVQRLEDLGVSPFLLAATARIFQAQRLVRTLCPHCGKRCPLDEATMRRKVRAGRLAQHEELFFRPGATVFDPVGCALCNHTGFSGRTAVMEMAVMTPELITAIEKKEPSRELERIARHSGYRPMIENGVDLICKGTTALSEIEAISLNANPFDDEPVDEEVADE